MKLAFLIVTLAVLAASSAGALEREAFQLREEFDMAPLSENAVQYYYYIPCPTYSWLWAFTGWEPGDIIGQWFQVGDISTGGWDACDPVNCHTLEQIRVADLAGYGCGRPWYEGYFTVEFDVYCADQYGCPVGPSLWNSGRWRRATDGT